MSFIGRVAREAAQWLVAGSVGFFGYRYYQQLYPAPLPKPVPAEVMPASERDSFNKQRKAELDSKGLK